ncbi:MAG: tRNA (guanosine(46)-N7)-methyltransferase TrmB [Rhodothermales bacterium]|nr:tRNA (guanosine(46)-N7)-methyltransferase TrmB [Rhodothermales bacterium]
MDHESGGPPLFLRPSASSVPLDGAELFGREADLVVEIGFGNGWFLEFLGSTHPSWNILGVELSVSSTTRAYKRLYRRQLPNVVMYRGDGRFLMRDVLRNESVSRIYVNFPDPWPRRRHLKRRLLNAAFLDLCATKLKPDGVLILTTDHPGYFEFARAQAIRSGAFREEVCEPEGALLETRYAQKWLDQQKEIFHVKFYRNAARPLVPPGVTLTDEDILMQHALMAGDLSSIAKFEKAVFHFEWGQVVMRDLFRTIDGKGLLFTVLVEEAGLKQDILVEVEPRREGIFVGVQKFGSPLATQGIGKAVGVVTDWLAARGLTKVKGWH